MQLDIKAMGEAVDAAIAADDGAPQPAATIAVGDTVISWGWESAITYGGPDEHGSEQVFVIGVGHGGVTVKCPPERVAPADTPLADAKDPRIKIDKYKSAAWIGDWWLRLPGVRASGHKTKRDAVATARRRLAILDWHAANPTT